VQEPCDIGVKVADLGNACWTVTNTNLSYSLTTRGTINSRWVIKTYEMYDMLKNCRFWTSENRYLLTATENNHVSVNILEGVRIWLTDCNTILRAFLFVSDFPSDRPVFWLTPGVPARAASNSSSRWCWRECWTDRVVGCSTVISRTTFRLASIAVWKRWSEPTMERRPTYGAPHAWCVTA